MSHIYVAVMILYEQMVSLLSPVDRHQRELPDNVGHYLQSLTPTASCDAHQDRLEQNPELQDWKRDAECLIASFA